MSVVSEAIKVLDSSSEATAKEVQSSLEMLAMLAEAKKDEMARYTDDRIKQALQNIEIPAGLKMFEASEIRVVTSKGPSDGIKDAVNNFLQDAETRWKEGVENLIGTALNTLLGSASGATSNCHYYIIALDGHAASNDSEETYVPVRIDYSLWVYNFKREGITTTQQSALAYHARKSLLDYSKIPSEIQIEQSLKNIGTPKALRDEIIKMIDVERNDQRPKNLVAYTENAPAAIRNVLKSI
jgi:hypothetical protein